MSSPVSNKVGNRRLLKLAAFLETKVPRKQFDMKDRLSTKPEDLKDPQCKTAACAMGWATTIPEFKKLGLKFTEQKNQYEETEYHVTFGKDADYGMKSAEQLFGISDDEAWQLFNSQGYAETPKQVAKRLRRFVAGRAED